MPRNLNNIVSLLIRLQDAVFPAWCDKRIPFFLFLEIVTENLQGTTVEPLALYFVDRE